MKRWFVTLGTILFLFFPGVSHAEVIRNFIEDVQVDTDRIVHVTETIVDDLGEDSRSGFVRLIPISTGYNGVVHSRDVHIEEITRNGQVVPFQTMEIDGYVRIDIGSDDAELTGVQKYVLRYSEGRAIDRVAGRDRLEWEVLATTWNTPIERAVFRIQFPEFKKQQI